MSNDTTRTVEPAHRFVSDLWRLGFILLLTLVVRVWVVSHAVVTSRDSLGFIRYALQLEDPPTAPEDPARVLTRSEVVQRAEHPPGYYVTVLLVSYPIRAVMGGTSCDSMVLSTQVSSVLAALLLTFPMYYLGRMLFDRPTAFVAALLFQSLPVWTAISSDGVSDGLFLLVGVTTLWLGGRAFQQPSAGRFLLVGMGAGAAYLIRPEGVLLLAAAGCTGISCVLGSQWRWRPGLFRMSGLVAGGLLIALPYILLIGKLTNKPTGKFITNTMLGNEAKPSWEESNVSVRPVSTAIFADWYSELHNRGESKEWWAFKHVIQQILKTLHYSLPFMAILGLYLLRRRIREDSAIRLLIVQLGIYLTALLALAMLAGYISQRHTLLISLIGCYLAAPALPKCGEWIARIGMIGRRMSPQTVAAVLAFVLVLSELPGDFKRLHANRAGHRAAGLWLAQNARPNEEIFDVFSWAEFYAGRNMKVLHDNFAYIGAKKVVYAVMEPRDPHSRLTNILEAKQIAAQGEPVYFWPEDNREKATVIVYRWDPHWK